MLQVAMKDRTLATILRLQAERQPHKPFLLFEGEATTYAEARAVACNVAFNLRRHGIRKGDHIAVFMDNHPEMLWALFGLATLGAIAIPLNTAAKGDQLLYLLRQSRASAIAVDAHLLPQLAPLLPDLPGIAHLFVRGADPAQGDWRR
jgi:crotonobetaine/carnitine-CoA ligase